MVHGLRSPVRRCKPGIPSLRPLLVGSCLSLNLPLLSLEMDKHIDILCGLSWTCCLLWTCYLLSHIMGQDYGPTSPTPFSPKPASLYCFVMITSFPLPHHLHFLKYCTRSKALYFPSFYFYFILYFPTPFSPHSHGLPVHKRHFFLSSCTFVLAFTDDEGVPRNV